MHRVLPFLVFLALLACSRVGPCSASPVNRGNGQVLEPDGNQQRLRRSPSPATARLGFGSLAEKHKELRKTAAQLATANGKGGLLEQNSQISTRQQQNAVVHKLGDKEEHSVSSAKTLDEKHSTAIADGLGGQSQNVSSLTSTDEKLSSSQIVAGIGQHVVSSQQTEDEKHTASSISAVGEEKHISSASSATDEKHSVFTSGVEDIIQPKSSPVAAAADDVGFAVPPARAVDPVPVASESSDPTSSYGRPKQEPEPASSFGPPPQEPAAEKRKSGTQGIVQRKSKPVAAAADSDGFAVPPAIAVDPVPDASESFEPISSYGRPKQEPEPASSFGPPPQEPAAEKRKSGTQGIVQRKSKPAAADSDGFAVPPAIAVDPVPDASESSQPISSYGRPEQEPEPAPSYGPPPQEPAAVISSYGRPEQEPEPVPSFGLPPQEPKPLSSYGRPEQEPEPVRS